MSHPLAWLHPRLASIPPEARWAALRESNRQSFDALELVAMAAAAVVAGWLPSLLPAWAGLALALAVTAVVLLRRCRRALRRMFGA